MPGFAHLPDRDIEGIIAFLHTQKAAPINKNSSELKALSNPIPDSITLDDLVVDLKLICQIAPSSDQMPRTRIAKLDHQPSTGQLFVVDLRGQLFSIHDAKPYLYLDLAKQQPHFIHQPGLATGFGSFAFHPEFEENGLLYTSHTEADGSAQADFAYADSIPVVVQWVLSEWKTSQPESPMFKGESRELMRINMVTGVHGVQEITFNPLANPGDQDYGLLYIGVGDGGSVVSGYTHLTQNRERIWGTILRIDPQGDDSANGKYGIPAGNPWGNNPDEKVLGEVYAFGFRNPHRISWSQTGLMLATNIGQKNIEALYQIQPGGNHGWPIREGTFMLNPVDDLNKVYALPADDQLFDIVYPIAQYDHDEGAAISGGYEYTGTDISELTGKYFFGDITSGRLFYINLSEVQSGQQANIKEWLVSFEGRVISLEDLCKNKRVDLRFGRDALGELYLFTKPDGKIYRLIGAERQSG
jgi:glucose/arabinose dehydrogenase